jgi:hypothetical protein
MGGFGKATPKPGKCLTPRNFIGESVIFGVVVTW